MNKRKRKKRLKRLIKSMVNESVNVFDQAYMDFICYGKTGLIHVSDNKIQYERPILFN